MRNSGIFIDRKRKNEIWLRFGYGVCAILSLYENFVQKIILSKDEKFIQDKEAKENDRK